MPSHNAVLDVLAGGLVRMEDGGHVTHDPTSSHTKSKGYGPGDQPVDSQWRAALRSYLAGTAGLPGDLEGLVRQGINWARSTSNGQQIDPTPVLPTTDFYKDWLPGKQEGSAPLADAASMAGGVGMLKGIRSVKSLGKAIAHAAPGPVAGGKMAQLGVIRNTGDNNFLKGSVENALAGLKRPSLETLMSYNPEYKARLLESLGMSEMPKGFVHPRDVPNIALNKFVEGPLTRYVKQQMATPDDPVRALAESGVLHYPADDIYSTFHKEHRVTAGKPVEGMAVTPLAKNWENITDGLLRPNTLEDWRNSPNSSKLLDGMPWLKDKPGTDMLHEFSNTSAVSEKLGFTHLTDELRNALNPESGLPRNLLLTPEKLQNMGMEKAVRHVAAINDWRAAQVAEANAKKANNAATVLHKEYPHSDATPNPKGLRWVELKQPKDTGKHVTVKRDEQNVADDGLDLFHNRMDELGVKHGTDEYDKYMDAFMDEGLDAVPRSMNADESYKQLQDALKYEGDIMKHCAGGYCDDVASGRMRIFSLRDAKGQPHVTIHTEPGYDPVPGYVGTAEEQTALPRIVQIKRKTNLVNSEPYEYRPFVQDFVKSGKWSDVGDMANTGLVEYSPRRQAVPTGLTGRTTMGVPFKDVGIPEGYYTEEELLGHMRDWQKRTGNEPGFATGGRVSMIHPAAAIQPLVRVPGFDRF